MTAPVWSMLVPSPPMGVVFAPLNASPKSQSADEPDCSCSGVDDSGGVWVVVVLLPVVVFVFVVELLLLLVVLVSGAGVDC